MALAQEAHVEGVSPKALVRAGAAGQQDTKAHRLEIALVVAGDPMEVAVSPGIAIVVPLVAEVQGHTAIQTHLVRWAVAEAV